MRREPFRVAVTAAVVCVSALLLACPLGRLRVLIPDFVTSDVRGIRLYRVSEANGALVAAGSLQFLGIETNAAPGGRDARLSAAHGGGSPLVRPVRTEVVRDGASLELHLSFLNQLPAGWFKVASYNAHGTSQPSTNQTFVASDES